MSLKKLDRCISTPIYIRQYGDVADVSYGQNSTDIYIVCVGTESHSSSWVCDTPTNFSLFGWAVLC